MSGCFDIVFDFNDTMPQMAQPNATAAMLIIMINFFKVYLFYCFVYLSPNRLTKMNTQLLIQKIQLFVNVF